MLQLFEELEDRSEKTSEHLACALARLASGRRKGSRRIFELCATVS